MAIAAFASVVAIVLAAILLMRFRKRWLAAFNLAVTNRISSRFAPRLPGFGIVTHVGRKSGPGLPDTSECFSSAGGIPDCAYLRTRKRMGQERNSRWRMQA